MCWRTRHNTRCSKRHQMGREGRQQLLTLDLFYQARKMARLCCAAPCPFNNLSSTCVLLRHSLGPCLSSC